MEPTKIIVYDFDGTLAKGDTTLNMFIYALRKGQLRAWIWTPVIIILLLIYMLNKQISKRRLFQWLWLKDLCIRSFMRPATARQFIHDFWDAHADKFIFPWVKDRINQDLAEADFVVCSSATAKPFLENIVKQLGINHLIGTEMNIETLRQQQPQNVRERKVDTLKMWAMAQGITSFVVEKMYTDSINDKPLLDIAREEYWVMKDGTLLCNHPNTKPCCQF